MSNKNTKAVYTIIEREDRKNLWLKIGVAFENNDGSLNVILNALPVNGKLHIRDMEKGQKEEDLPFSKVSDLYLSVR
jgi:hypothetical protein